MQFKLGQIVSVNGRKVTIVQIHNLFDDYFYTVQSNSNYLEDVFTISEEEIGLC